MRKHCALLEKHMRSSPKLVLCCIIYSLLCVFNTSPLYHLRGSLDYLLTKSTEQKRRNINNTETQRVQNRRNTGNTKNTEQKKYRRTGNKGGIRKKTNKPRERSRKHNRLRKEDQRKVKQQIKQEDNPSQEGRKAGKQASRKDRYAKQKQKQKDTPALPA